VKQVAGASAFEAMKASFEDANKKRKEQGKAVKDNHIRQGSKGTWSKMLNGPLLAAFEERHQSQVSALEFPFEFDYGDGVAQKADDRVDKPMDEQGYFHVMVQGVVYPGFARESTIQDMQEKFELQEDDIVIATYPKCGTTWMQQIVLTLLFEGDKSKVVEPMHQSPWMEAVVCMKAIGMPSDVHGELRSREELSAWDGSTRFGKGPGRRVFKTHAPVHLAPWVGGTSSLSKSKAKVIVVARNPKDACVSLFHHSRDMPPCAYKGDFEHFVTSLFLQGKVQSGCFWEWHAAWWNISQSNPNILWITYEEMKADTIQCIRRIGSFLGTSVSDDVVKQVAGASSFDAMKASFEDANKKRKEEGKQVKENHIRQGAKGTWSKMLNGPLLDKFEDRHRSQMSALEIPFEFDYGDGVAQKGDDNVQLAFSPLAR
jgi:hypothetical protein